MRLNRMPPGHDVLRDVDSQETHNLTEENIERQLKAWDVCSAV